MAEADHTPRVLCIAGSPRRHGNSESLLDATIEGIRSAGGDAIKLVARDASVGVCLGCNSCSSDGRCIQRDRMDEVYRELDTSDAIVVSTPVFFATVPAVLKTLLDRCQPYWARRYVLGEKPRASKRPGAILVVGGGGDPFGTGCAVTPIRSVFAVLSVSTDHTVEAVGPDKRGDIACESHTLRQARDVGTSLVEAVRSGPR
jgi:multimeric flavodoxin WrbA